MEKIKNFRKLWLLLFFSNLNNLENVKQTIETIIILTDIEK